MYPDAPALIGAFKIKESVLFLSAMILRRKSLA
jgi:hypothetical protein